jgi:hypothetical protein
VKIKKKINSLLKRNPVPVPSSYNMFGLDPDPDPDFLPIPDPGSRGKKAPIPDLDPQLWLKFEMCWSAV